MKTTPMKLWILAPAPDKLNSSHWKASTYTGETIIRAINENAARDLADERFHQIGEIDDQNTTHSPWLQPDIVLCKEYEGAEFDQKGGPAILQPKPEHE